MKFSKQDRVVLRDLARRMAEIAGDSVQSETESEWRRVNGLGMGRAMVCISDVPWDEMNVDGELSLRTTDPFARNIEHWLRVRLYRWNHMRTDEVMEPVFRMPIAMRSGEGQAMDDGLATAEGVALGSFKGDTLPRILGGAGSENVVGEVDDELTTQRFEALNDAFGDILSVEPCGVSEQVFSPWESLERQWGAVALVENIERSPAKVRAALDYLYTRQVERLDLCQEARILSLNNGNTGIAGGGPGFCDELPQRNFNPACIELKDQWGWTRPPPAGFTPRMEQHVAFALPYEKRWLEMFGLAAYGWGDALASKPSLFAEFPNLRKICLTSATDLADLVEHIGCKYTYSVRVSADCLAGDTWDLNEARERLIRQIEIPCSIRCPMEVVLEGVRTVRGQPRRLWEWARMAMDVVASL